MRLRDGEENGGDLEDIVKVLFGSRSVLKEFVLVASKLKTFLAWRGISGVLFKKNKMTFGAKRESRQEVVEGKGAWREE